jgi:uncharacterized protein (TIGR02246 family)
MNRWHLVACATGLMMFLAGCTQTPPAAPDTRAADEKAIKDDEVAWNSDWAAKDLDKILGHYADDAALMVPGAPLMKGKDAIRMGLPQMLGDANLSLKFASSSVEVSKGGDLAYTQGMYTLMQTDPKTKKPMTEKGKFVTVYRKGADGSWKAIEDINNADPPEPPPAKSK